MGNANRFHIIIARDPPTGGVSKLSTSAARADAEHSLCSTLDACRQPECPNKPGAIDDVPGSRYGHDALQIKSSGAWAPRSAKGTLTRVLPNSFGFSTYRSTIFFHAVSAFRAFQRDRDAQRTTCHQRITLLLPAAGLGPLPPAPPAAIEKPRRGR